jgi:alpha-aminoadipate carrier protein LysW
MPFLSIRVAASMVHGTIAPMGVDFTPAVYNTLDGGARGSSSANLLNHATEDGAVIRCPECSAEIDVDEDEVEEGEILSCPECESELEVSQTHPVHLNVISDDLDDDDEDEEEEEKEEGENGDAPDEEEEEEEEEDVE